MKKLMVLSLVTLAAASQANAQGRAVETGRSRGYDVRAVDQAAKEAGRAGETARAAVAPAGQGAAVLAAFNNTGLPRLASNEATALQSQLVAANDNVSAKNADIVKTQMDRIVADANNTELRDLNAEQARGLARLGGVDLTSADTAVAALDPEARAGSTYGVLVTSAAEQARGWSAAERGNLVKLLVAANDNIQVRPATNDVTDVRRVGRGLLKAVEQVKAQGLTVDPEAIRTACKR